MIENYKDKENRDKNNGKGHEIKKNQNVKKKKNKIYSCLLLQLYNIIYYDYK